MDFHIENAGWTREYYQGRVPSTRPIIAFPACPVALAVVQSSDGPGHPSQAVPVRAVSLLSTWIKGIS